MILRAISIDLKGWHAFIIGKLKNKTTNADCGIVFSFLGRILYQGVLSMNFCCVKCWLKFMVESCGFIYVRFYVGGKRI